MSPLSRRALLRGAGGVALGLPFLEAMLRRGRTHAQPGTIPRKVVFFFTANGVVPDTWWPTGGERDFVLNRAHEPLQAFREKLIIVDGVRMQTAIDRSGGNNGHDVGTAHCLTCRPVQQGPSGVGEFGHLWDGSAAGFQSISTLPIR